MGIGINTGKVVAGADRLRRVPRLHGDRRGGQPHLAHRGLQPARPGADQRLDLQPLPRTSRSVGEPLEVHVKGQAGARCASARCSASLARQGDAAPGDPPQPAGRGAPAVPLPAAAAARRVDRGVRAAPSATSATTACSPRWRSRSSSTPSSSCAIDLLQVRLPRAGRLRPRRQDRSARRRLRSPASSSPRSARRATRRSRSFVHHGAAGRGAPLACPPQSRPVKFREVWAWACTTSPTRATPPW